MDANMVPKSEHPSTFVSVYRRLKSEPRETRMDADEHGWNCDRRTARSWQPQDRTEIVNIVAEVPLLRDRNTKNLMVWAGHGLVHSVPSVCSVVGPMS
jgi:hypothetical protein